MTVLFITAGGKRWASSRMRAHWPAEYMDADVMTFDEATEAEWPGGFEVVIFQKAISLSAAQAYKDRGIPVWWDMCDPSWWWGPDDVAKIADIVDGVVLSNESLQRDFEHWLKSVDADPIVTAIPDRLERDHFEENRKREHVDHRPIRFIWYGIANNRISLYAALASLERLVCNQYAIELTIMDERPDVQFQTTRYFPIYHKEWSLREEVRVIAAHDIAILPPYPGAWGEVKSKNKWLTASACGVPVATAARYSDLVRLMDADARQEKADNDREHTWRFYDVRQTAAEWDELLCGSYRTKEGAKE